MAKKRRQNLESSKIEEIPEAEQRRIIEESGVLQRVPRDDNGNKNQTAVNVAASPSAEEDTGEDTDVSSSLCDEVFHATLSIIPFSSLYIMMDILAHRQYSRPYTVSVILERVIYGIPILSAFIFYTIRHKGNRRLQAILFLLSIICGSRLIYVVNWSNWKTVITQCPPLGTIWVYTVFQLDLLPAVLALAVVSAFVYFKNLKIIL